MKRLGTAAAIAVLLAVSSAPSKSASILTENFVYANGGLVAVSGGNWTNTSGTGTDIQVVSNAAVGNNSNAPDDNRVFPGGAISNTATTYACFRVTIPAPAATPIVGGYFAHFKDATTTNFVSRLYALPVTGDATHFTFGISVYSATTMAFLGVWPGSLNFGQAYWITMAFDAAGKTAKLWVNPGSPFSPSVTSSTSSAVIPAVAITAFALRQSSTGSPLAGTPAWSYKVENIGVGPTLYDACAFTGITETKGSTWGQLRKLYR